MKHTSPFSGSNKTPSQNKEERKKLSKEIRTEMKTGKFAKDAVKVVLAKRKKK